MANVAKPVQALERLPASQSSNASATAPATAAKSAPAQASSAALQPTAPAAPTPPPDLAVYCPDRTAPAYPSAARRRGLEGTVVLQVTLGVSGRVQAASVERSSGIAMLDRAALAAVRRWRCQPPRVGGVSRSAVLQQRIDFILQ